MVTTQPTRIQETQKPALYFGACPKELCNLLLRGCSVPINLATTSAVAAEIQITSELDFARAESWKNKQTGEVPLTHCIPVSWLQPGRDRRQVSVAEQHSERHGPGSPKSFPFLGIWGLCLQLSPKMLHPSEAAPPFSTKAAVSPGAGQRPALHPSLLHTPALHRGCNTLLLLSKLPEVCQGYISY